jgi:hypothetical protein
MGTIIINPFRFAAEPEPITTTLFLGSGNDDGYLYGGSSGSSFDNSTGQLIICGNTARTFYRFQMPDDLTQGSTIVSAYLTIYMRSAPRNYDSSCTVRAYNADNGPAITTSAIAAGQAGNNTNLTTANVAWSVPAYTTDGTVRTSPNIASVLQEVVNRPGFSAGNYINIWCRGSAGAGDHYAYTRNYGVSSMHPKLELTYIPK